MLKHLFGKRDKELDVLQEEALQSPLRTVVRNFTSNRLAFGGLIVFLVIFLIVLIGPIFNPIDLSEKEETQINVAPGLNMMKVPDGLKTCPYQIYYRSPHFSTVHLHELRHVSH